MGQASVTEAPAPEGGKAGQHTRGQPSSLTVSSAWGRVGKAGGQWLQEVGGPWEKL